MRRFSVAPPASVVPLVALVALVAPVATAAAGCSEDNVVSPAPLPGYDGPTHVTLSSPQASVALRLDVFDMKIRSKSGEVLLDAWDAADAVAGDEAGAFGPLGVNHRKVKLRKAIIEGWDHEEPEDTKWLHGAHAVAARVSTESASIDLAAEGQREPSLRLEIWVNGAEVRVEARALGTGPDTTDPTGEDEAEPGYNQMGQAFTLPPDEHFYGLGEQYLTVDHRGQGRYLWTEEGGVGAGEKTPKGTKTNPSPNGPSMTHLPIPFLLSSKGWGLWLETTHRATFSLGDQAPGAWRMTAAEPYLRYRVLVHDTPRETLSHFTKLSGRAELPAPWVFGPRRRVDRGKLIDGVEEPRALRVKDVATTMVDDTNHFLPIASEKGHEDELAAWTKEMHGLGFKAIGYYNAYVSVTDPRAKELSDYGTAHDLFVKTKEGKRFDTFMISAGPQTVATIDFTNPDAVAWYQTILDRALGLGYDGWMLDFGEYLPHGARMWDGRSGWEMHNAYPVLYQKTTFEYLRKVKGDDFMFFARSGWTGSQQYAPVIWSGDPAASFDDAKGLPAQVRAGISIGLSGIPFWGSDVSGYTCLNDPIPDKDLYLRWAEFGALSPDMHDENACAQAPAGSPPKWNLWTDAETIAVYGKYARLHTRLIPYLYAAAKVATETGIPIIRHPLLEHPAEPAARGVELEYYFGPALYVAPVVARKATTRSFWLPPGKWVDWWTLEALTGGAEVTRDAPLDTLPLLLRSGGVVALLDPAIDTLAPEDDPDVVGPTDVAGVLDVRAAIDAQTGTGTATLADGTTLTVSFTGQPPVAQTQASEASLASCSGCARVDALPGGVIRVRASTPTEASGTTTLGGLSLAHAGAAARVRWDVTVLP